MVYFELTVPNSYCGRVIGKGGKKINMITVCDMQGILVKNKKCAYCLSRYYLLSSLFFSIFNLYLEPAPPTCHLYFCLLHRLLFSWSSAYYLIIK